MKNNGQDEIKPGQIAAVTLFSILLALVLLWLAALEIKVESSKQAEAKSTPVAHKQPASTKKLRRKGKTKMVQIVRGTTGQADVYSDWTTPVSCRPIFYIEGSPGYWYISEGSPTVGGALVGDANVPSNWDLSSFGSVIVPIDAKPGVYTGYIVTGTGESCSLEGGPGEIKGENWYEFEVVCMKATITASKNPPTP